MGSCSSSAAAAGNRSDTDQNEDGLILQTQSTQLASSDVTIEVCIGIPSVFSAFQGFSLTNQVEPCTDQCICTHPYLNKWDGIYNCMYCRYELNDTPEAIEKNADRIALEAKLEKETPEDIVGAGQSVGSMSAARGVKIGWLLTFTKYHDCYEWNSGDIIRKILKPATEERRCRVVELPEMASFVGPAKTFISYAQAGKWGDLVAAIADGGADLDRCVWIDLFAVRQWPSDKPDLDFASTIEHCSSFMVVCSYQEEVGEMDDEDIYSGFISIYDLDMSVKRQICFARVWCLVEAHKACAMPGLPFMMKVGQHVLRADGTLEFIPAPGDMIHNLYYSVDVEKAEATVQSDRQRIINDIVAGVGVNKLNSTIKSAMAEGNTTNSTTLCAACGDENAIQTVLADPENIFDICGGGFESLLKALLDSDIIADIDMRMKDENNGATALTCASFQGHESCVRVLLEAGADKDAMGPGRTPLACASYNGHESCVRALLEAGADTEILDYEGWTALEIASDFGHESVVQALLESGASKK
jgi:hypothetical protein